MRSNGHALKTPDPFLNPDNCTLEDIQYHLYVLEKIKCGVANIEAGRTRTQEQGEQRLHKWLHDRDSRGIELRPSRLPSACMPSPQVYTYHQLISEN